MKMIETKFGFAGKTVLIKTNNKKISQSMNARFPEFLSKKKADFTLEYFFSEGNTEHNL